ncbi:MAG TPA: hypothetical protein VET48_02920, partial [Steroidobacteraceae bacterium]|nr:hypothetical protein [Steroidobacteraceae bacterium]
RVQVFILPYHAESKLTSQGRQLATIMQRHVLFAALKYPSIAIEELTVTGNSCDVEHVEQRVMPRLNQGQVAIFLWGRLFEQGSVIRLQSSVVFMSKGTQDTLAWTVAEGEASKVSATVPSDPVVFAARSIPLSFLEALQSAQAEARRLHRAPDSNSPFWELPQSPDARFGFEVVETKNDWMHVRLLPGGGDGWVPAHALATADDLKGAFPELYFVDGLIGYHQLLANDNVRSSSIRQRVIDGALASFDQYIQLSEGRAESDARALAAILKGNTRLRGETNERWSLDALKSAQREYREAERLSPTSTTASSFYLACTSALCNRGECAEGTQQLHDHFLAAVARDPSDRQLLNNLSVFYAAAESGKFKVELKHQSIAEQRAIVERAAK